MGKIATRQECNSIAGKQLFTSDLNKCVAKSEVASTGVPPDSMDYPDRPQRTNCLCLSKKNILGVKPGRCPHKCIYCYWKD